ncbi:MAG TPA: inorganic phosphate transporter [Mycobacteriales bacterium]|nr:inorganic phosphate transporter [Mycobacteriales bacterium]
MVSASLVSLAHGTNDAQKTMGVITLTLITAGSLPSGAGLPFWVIISAGAAIALGTYLGEWRIIRTLGTRLTRIEAPQGFAAEASAAAVILTSSHLGFALSTTHVCSGAIIGSGIGKRLAEVRWEVAGRMVTARVLTLPAAAAVGALAGRLASTGTSGTVLVGLVGGATVAVIYLVSRRDRFSAHNVTDELTGARPVPAPTTA